MQDAGEYLFAMQLSCSANLVKFNLLALLVGNSKKESLPKLERLSTHYLTE